MIQNAPVRPRPTEEEFRTLTHRVLREGNRPISHADFLRETVRLVMGFCKCKRVELHLRENGGGLICTSWQTSNATAPNAEVVIRRSDKIVLGIAGGGRTATDSDGCPALALPLVIADEVIGNLLICFPRQTPLPEADLALWESVAPTLGFAIINQRAQWALRERVKELTCLYGIANIVEQPGISLYEILQGAVELLPPGWQYPEITCARIRLDDKVFVTTGFAESPFRQSADILVRGELRGGVDVFYREEKPESDEGPFLREERNLIGAIAGQLALIIERREAEDERARLQEQLRHADRLATIGQLAAGVAHELNEPLGGILGFAQLIRKSKPAPAEQSARDVDRIITSALYAREVVKKLLLFARQMPPQKIRINLNRIINDIIPFFESRCAKQGIELTAETDPALPEITADPAQLHQVLINLVVNAVQATTGVGRITVRTYREGGDVVLTVEDTGMGMSSEVQKQVFVPFFTTKDVNQGTGIGLAVVHGIVVSHGGTISFQSAVNQGTTFTVRLPIESQPNEGDAELTATDARSRVDVG